MTHPTEVDAIVVIIFSTNIATVIYSIDYSKDTSFEKSISNKATELYEEMGMCLVEDDVHYTVTVYLRLI